MYCLRFLIFSDCSCDCGDCASSSSGCLKVLLKVVCFHVFHQSFPLIPLSLFAVSNKR